MNDDFVPLRVAAETLGISLRHCQRLAQKVADSDKEVAPGGAIKVRVAALATLLPAHDKSMTSGDASASQVASRVTALESALAQAKAALEEVRRDRERWYDAHQQAQKDASEWRRLLVASNPKLLPPPGDDVVLGQATQEGSDHSHEPFWARWWSRRS